MYQCNLRTGETTFHWRGAAARRVTLVCDPDSPRPRRAPMQPAADGWQASLELPVGWHFYAFEVDGRRRWDRDTGKLRTRGGQPCSLAVITSPRALSAA